jgi:hypothetical protein
VSDSLPSAFCRALGKVRLSVTSLFTERRTLGKDMFAECLTLDKEGAWQTAVSGRPKADGRQPLPSATVFAEGHDSRHSAKLTSLPSAKEDTRQRIRHRHLAP